MSDQKSSGQTPEEIFLEAQLQNLHHHKNTLLQQVSSHFFLETSLTFKVGIELEFYLTNLDQSQISNDQIVTNFIADLIKQIPQNSTIYKVEKEQGQGQIEVKTAFDSDLSKVCHDILDIKFRAKTLAQQKNLIASFVAQPFLNDCGSALQFNISLHDKDGGNILFSDNQLLVKVASSLLENTDAMMIFLAPHPQDYVRFSKEINRDLFKKGKFIAPTNLSFGADNRTCAIRIPAKSQRLEYRVAAANCDPALSISAILLAILSGIKSDTESQKQIHGNAFDEQYQVKDFCQDFDEAKRKFFAEDNLIREQFLYFLRG
jgi:gamma-glutamylputrescine synthase